MSMQDLPRGQHVTVAAPTGGWLVDVLAIWDGPFYDTGHPEYQVAPISEFGLHEIRSRRIAASQLWVYRAAGQSKHTSQIPEHDDLKMASPAQARTAPPHRSCGSAPPRICPRCPGRGSGTSTAPAGWSRSRSPSRTTAPARSWSM